MHTPAQVISSGRLRVCNNLDFWSQSSALQSTLQPVVLAMEDVYEPLQLCAVEKFETKFTVHRLEEFPSMFDSHVSFNVGWDGTILLLYGGQVFFDINFLQREVLRPLGYATITRVVSFCSYLHGYGIHTSSVLVQYEYVTERSLLHESLAKPGMGLASLN